MEQPIEGVPANDIQVPASTATLDDASLLLLDPQLQALTSEPSAAAAASTPISLDQPVAAAAATLNADAINASTEQEHIQHAENQDAIEDAIVQADANANANADSDIAVEPPILEDSASKQVKEEKLEETVMNLLREDIRDIAASNAANPTAGPVTESIDVEEGGDGRGSGSGSSDLSTEAIEPSVNGNADTSGSGRDRSTSAHPGGENAERGDTPSFLPASQQPITTKGRSASATSSTMTAASRPQRRTASSAKKAAEKDTPPLSASSRTSSRRAANGKDKDLAGTSSEKPTSSAGGTARTRGLAQKAQDKAEKDIEKQRRSTRPKAKKGDSSRSVPDLEDLDNEDEEEDQGDGEAHGADDDGDDGITRCICGNNEDDAPGFMIMCETCKAWQHGPCMGFKVENECPDTYYCELCRPDLHPKVHGTASTSSRTTSKRGHGRTVSSSSRARGTSRDVSVKEDLAASSSSSMARPPLSRDRESSASVPPPSATSTSHPPHHRSRASADAAVIQSFMDSNRNKGQASPSPSPASPGGTPGSGPLAADGKRPMYPPTSHLSAPALPKRRSTMNSRESAAFDESIMLANVNAFKESRLMASSSGSGDNNKRKRKKKEDSEGLDREDSLTMEAVKEEDEDEEEGIKEEASQQDPDMSASSDMPSGKRLKLDPAASVEPSAPTGAQPDADHQGDETVIGHMEIDDVPEEATIDESGAQEDVLEDGQDAPGTGPKKRRRRRGPGATAPVRKKTPAKPRASRPRTALEIATNSIALTEGEDTEAPETPATATAANFEGSLAGEEGEEPLPSVMSAAANRSARKRKSMAADEEIPTVVLQAAQGQSGRAVSPSASVVTADSSNSSDKPLAQQALPAAAAAAAAEASSNGLQRTGSAQDLTNGTTKDASGRVNLMPPSAVARGKRPAKGQLTADETEEDHDSERATTPAPFAFLSPADTAPLSTSGTTSRGGKAATRGRGGGPGSRGGKHSPHKRGGFAGVDGRKGHKDRDDTPGAFDDFSNQPPTWNLPDHLHHLAHLLPSPHPNPLSVPAYVHTPQVSSAPSPTEAAPNGIAAEAGAAISSASTSSSGASVQQQLPIPVKHLEPCAKVRFPPRRVSMTEMKKRAKHVLDYLGRIQMDMVERSNRSRALGIATASPPTSAAGTASGSDSQTPQSAELLDNLSRQLINFQEKFT